MEYTSKTVKEFQYIARQIGVVGYSRLRKADLIAVISGDVKPKSTFLDDWLRGRIPERGVKSALAQPPVPKPVGSRTTIGKIYGKTKSAVNTIVQWIEKK